MIVIRTDDLIDNDNNNDLSTNNGNNIQKKAGLQRA